MKKPEPYYLTDNVPLDQFLLGLFSMGTPIDVSVVGNFGDHQRGSRRDIDLPPHKDGVFSKELSDVQNGYYIERPGVHIVGLYCLRAGAEPCYTTIGDSEIDLRAGQGLVFDNEAMSHGRRGPVGERVLLRIWITKK